AGRSGIPRSAWSALFRGGAKPRGYVGARVPAPGRTAAGTAAGHRDRPHRTDHALRGIPERPAVLPGPVRHAEDAAARDPRPHGPGAEPGGGDARPGGAADAERL